MPINIISIRLLSQQLACPQFSTPDEVVSHFGIMQAQDYRMMRWAVSMRTAKPSSAAFKFAFDEGRIIRMHLNRGTWQLVSRDVVLDPRFVHKAHSNNGIFHPVILSDGRVCGNWRRSSLELEFFDGCVHDQALLEPAVSRYKSFMNFR